MAHRPRGRTVVAGGAAVVVLAGGGVAWAETRSSGPAYRLADVTRSDVAQTVTEVGTISSINQRAVSFPVSGTVAAVKVALGDTVTAGQVLATLDTTTLQQQVTSDTGSVASARQRLADDEANQASSESTDASSVRQLGAASSATTGTPTGSTPPSGSGKSTHPGSPTITQLQAAVVADQKAVDGGLATVTSDLAALKSACASSTVTFTAGSDADGIIHGTVTGAAGLPVSIPSDTDAAGNAIPSTTVGPDGTFTFGSTAAPLKASATYTVQLGDDTQGIAAAMSCQTALTTAQNDEQQVATTERSLAADEQKLDAAIVALQSQTGSGSGSGGTGGSGGAGGSGGGSGKSGGSSTKSGGSSSAASGGSGFTGSSGRSGSGQSASGQTGTGQSSLGQSGGTTITAEDLAADQKEIDAAAAQLVVAQQNLTAGTLRAPISGTVADVSITSGAGVSAASSTSTITIIGTGQKEVVTTVGLADIDLVKAGDTVSVTVDGVSTALPGKVTQVGVLNTSGTSGDTTTYPVTVVLDPTSLALYDGAGATVAIDVGTAKNVLTVPSSAVSSLGTRSVVQVYSKGKVTRTIVTTGVSGPDRTEVKTGLSAGQQVVLADLHAPVPSSNSTTNRFSRFTTGGGGLGALTTSGGGGLTGRGGR